MTAAFLFAFAVVLLIHDYPSGEEFTLVMPR
jgi:hypothetical protein